MYTTYDLDRALKAKKQKLVLKIINSKTFDVKRAGDIGFSPMHLAAIYGNLEAAKLLRTFGAYIDEDTSSKMTPLHYAAMHGHKKIVEFLVSERAVVNSSDARGKYPLDYAFINGHADVIEFLIEKGAYTYNGSYTDKEDYGRKSYLHFAVSKGHLKTVEVLLKKEKFNIDHTIYKSLTSLHIASAKGHTELVKFLIENGADLEATSERGNTPLHLAAINRHDEIVDLLINEGADLEAINEAGNTALRIAASNGSIDIVIRLLEAGANIQGFDTEEGIAFANIQQIIKGLQVIESIREFSEEPFEDEIIASILAFSDNQNVASIIFNRTKTICSNSEGKEFIPTLEVISKIIDKALGNCPLLEDLIHKQIIINYQYMGIAEALANIITAKPVQVDMLEDIRSQKTSGIEAQETEADEFLNENPFLKLIYETCYGEGGGGELLNVNYYETVLLILEGKTLEREGVSLSLMDALNQSTGIVEFGRHLTALEQATDNVILTERLENLLDILKSHYKSLEESANEAEEREAVESEGDEADEGAAGASASSASEGQLTGKKVKRSEYEERHPSSEEGFNFEAFIAEVNDSNQGPEVLGAESATLQQ